jgi:glutamate-1-semialdehyde 2,1-aminomutase
MGGRYDKEAEGRPFAIQGMLDDYRYSEGRSPGANEESFMLPYNEIEILEDTLKKYGEEIALIHFEPYVVNHGCQTPRPGYLERVRELCDEYGIVMSFDEIITGFRLAIGGAQERFGVTPDLATFGKALGGGMPLSAVAGKAEILELLGENRVLSPGTFNAFPLSVRSALTAIHILERDDCAIYKEMSKKTRRLMDGLREIAKRRDLPIRIQGETGVFMMLFGVEPEQVYYSDEEVTLDRTMGIVFWSKMTERGIIMMPDARWYVSAVVTDEDIDRSLEAADETLGEMV